MRPHSWSFCISCNNSRAFCLMCNSNHLHYLPSSLHTCIYKHFPSHTNTDTHFHPFIKQILWGIYSEPGTGCVCVTPDYIERRFTEHNVKCISSADRGLEFWAHSPSCMNLAKLSWIIFSSSAITVLYKNLYAHLPGFGAKIKAGAGWGVVDSSQASILGVCPSSRLRLPWQPLCLPWSLSS